LALHFAGQCNGSIQALTMQIAEFSMAFNCVERVKEYATALSAEAALITDMRPPSGWPTDGALEVHWLRLRYRPELPLVLKGLSFVAAAGERLGVVGRTGAGKTSLLLALLRVVEPELGSVMRLDGQDLLALGIHDVRKHIGMIPQEPVLFQETLRYNCDPYRQHSSAEIWRALDDAQMASWLRECNGSESACSSEPSGSAAGAAGPAVSAEGPGSAVAPSDLDALLQIEIKEGGTNLSAGQRQMVALARAVLRRARLVVLDEATAAVDAETDAAIQIAVRRCFHGATMLTIAHRLQTILDSDRVLVLSEGELAEIGPPGELRAQKGGVFRGMVEEAGH